MNKVDSNVNKPYLDPATLSIVWYKLASVTREMGITAMKTSRNPLFHVCHDFSCFVTDGVGRALAYVEGSPDHVGAGGMAVKKVLEYYRGDIHPGDCFLVSDVYLGGGNHLPDWLIVTPVFTENELSCVACIRAHQIDIGGPVAGSYNPAATDIYQEGLRIPPIRIAESRNLKQDIVNLILANVRQPETIYGDLQAMVGVTFVAADRLDEFLTPYGIKATKGYLDGILDYGESTMRAELRKIPNGVYFGKEQIELADRLAEIPVKLTINDDSAIVDFTGVESQLPDPRNSALANTVSSVVMALYGAVDPSIPHNEGALRPVKIIAPPGTMVNPTYPAATALGPGALCLDIAYAVSRALAQAIPEQVIAGSMKMIWPTSHGIDPVTKSVIILYHYHATGGAGAIEGRDGINVLASAWGGLLMPNTEEYEMEYPIEVQRWEFRRDGGGAGEFRGGTGVEYEVKYLIPMTNLFRTQGLRLGPYSVKGGKLGATTFVAINPGTNKRRIPPALCTQPIDKGEILLVSCSGGGGWGHPFNRDPEKVREDVINGIVSYERALSEYGVALNKETCVIDMARTRELRKGVLS